MILRPDLRSHLDETEMRCKCRQCGATIMQLPDDRRQGYCFDCYDPLEVSSKMFGPNVPGPTVIMRCKIGRD